MSLKHFAYLALRKRNYSPREALRVINIAITSSVCTGASFEVCINIAQECHGKPEIFSI